MNQLFFLILLGLSANVLAQTPGEIFITSTASPNPMDPNTDGFVSVGGSGYAAGVEDNEIDWIGIPQAQPEPDGDNSGGSCGATDIIDDPSTGADASYVYFDDTNDYMIYRIRMARSAAGAFGFSVLVDTDGKFGFTGADADANAVSGNPGFEFEIRLVSGGGSGLFVENVDGSTSTNSTDFSYTLASNTQRAYARFTSAACSGQDPVFYDFFIPISNLGLTESSVIRLAAATSSSPANSVLSNISDIAGTDDDSFVDTDDAWTTLIALQEDGTSVGNIGAGGCFLSGTSDTPVVSPIIFDSNSRINGTSTEPEGAFITVFNNGDTLGTTTNVNADGRWSVTFTQGDLRPFDEITVIARDSCENESVASVKLNVVDDLDSDDDGIPDSEEGNGVDPGADSDGDDIPNYLDTDYPGFIDISPADGINDQFDLDGDGIPNHFDTDANGDGLPDNAGAGGSLLDPDNDGIIDVMEDADGDGIPDSADVDFTGGTDADNDGIDDSTQGGTDTDGDGIQDSSDPDSDGDGLSDAIDGNNGGIPLTITDIDTDGLLDFLDLDADGDGISNVTETAADSDGDGIPNFQDIDSDGDGILDNIEAQTAAAYIAPTGIDSDGDGLDNAYDTDDGGTTITPVDTDSDSVVDYLDVDSDGDGIGDYTEGNDSNLNGIADNVDVSLTGGADADADGIDDAFDPDFAACTDTYNANDGSATADGICDAVQAGAATDTDGDGLADIYDTDNGGTPVALFDSDGDGVPNYQDSDDDGDGILSSIEGTGFTQGGQPIPDYLFNPDYDGDGINDSADLDSDNDGILDADEDGGTGFDPTGDEDGDGIFNFLDTNDVVSGLTFTDTNGDGVNDIYDFDLDGIPDFHDLDADGDGILDILEAGGTDANGDGIVDGFTDANSDGIDDTIGISGLTLTDFDGDGLNDYLDIDSDNDGIVDNVEAQGSATYIAPTGLDSDGDGIDNAYDVDSGGTPIVPVNTDSTGNPDYIDTDSDDDGVNDIIEGHDINLDGIGDWDTNGNGVVNGAEGTGDADGDGLLDAFDTDNTNYNPTGSNSSVQDSDGDGISNFQDSDDDGDGTDTSVEGTGFTQGGSPIPDYLYNPDSDGDGIIDSADLDSDSDGIPDVSEDGGTGFDPSGDADGDGILNYLDDTDGPPTNGMPAFTDVNGDGINDVYDADLDGIPDFQDLDSDNDGVFDILEAGGTDADGDGIADDLTDTDGDGLLDLFDTDDGGTPLANVDTDGDGVTDAFDKDSDNDGLPDIIENGGIDADGNGVADSSTDTDGDGILDIYDLDNGGTPTTDLDTDGDTVPDKRDLDSDGDGITDLVEAGGSDSNNDGLLDNLTDTDGDGFADLIDPDDGGAALTNPDTDADGIFDAQDADSDGDGITDNVEAQTEGGYVAPNGVSDGNGFDTAYSGAGLVPEDTDSDGTPDYQDTDSDGDSILDRIEGNDADANGLADTSPSGMDTDGDGLDNTFDPDDGGTALSPQDLDTDGVNDYRDTDDDGDGVKSVDEPLDTNPVNGIPNYLEDNVGSCGVGFVTTDFNGSADAVFSNSGVTNFSNATGVSDNAFATLDDVGDFFILQLVDEIPQGNSINIRYSSSTNKNITLSVTSSLTSGGTYADAQTFSSASSTLVTAAYNVNTTGGIKYLRIALTAATNPANGRLDAVTYSFTQCDSDLDLDGIPDAMDADVDNDGIPDVTEIGATLLADEDGDGTLNFEDTDYTGFVDTNADGIDDNADFDLDGIPNHKDLDSDNDGITDAVEANDGVLPSNMLDEGRYPVFYVQINDFDGDGFVNVRDLDNGGTALPTSNTDGTGNFDFLDTDSDDDGQSDFIEAGDTDGNGASLNEYIQLAANFEAAAGNPGYYTTADGDADGIPNWLEDDDGDGVLNFLDPEGAGSAFYQDTDADGLVDLFDADNFGAALALADSDSDGIPDYLDTSDIVSLPVELVHFSGTFVDGTIRLMWQTASEQYNSHFNIEKSIDGESFQEIGRAEGSGTTSELVEYNFTDNNPTNGATYYRLNQVDYDGRNEYSDLIRVVAELTPFRVDVYPNPTADYLNIRMNSNVVEMRLTLIDLKGGVLVESHENDALGTSHVILDLTSIKNGVYVLLLNANGNTEQFYVVIQHP